MCLCLDFKTIRKMKGLWQVWGCKNNLIGVTRDECLGHQREGLRSHTWVMPLLFKTALLAPSDKRSARSLKSEVASFYLWRSRGRNKKTQGWWKPKGPYSDKQAGWILKLRGMGGKGTGRGKGDLENQAKERAVIATTMPVRATVHNSSRPL